MSISAVSGLPSSNALSHPWDSFKPRILGSDFSGQHPIASTSLDRAAAPMSFRQDGNDTIITIDLTQGHKGGGLTVTDDKGNAHTVVLAAGASTNGFSMININPEPAQSNSSPPFSFFNLPTPFQSNTQSHATTAPSSTANTSGITSSPSSTSSAERPASSVGQSTEPIKKRPYTFGWQGKPTEFDSLVTSVNQSRHPDPEARWAAFHKNLAALSYLDVQSDKKAAYELARELTLLHGQSTVPPSAENLEQLLSNHASSYGSRSLQDSATQLRETLTEDSTLDVAYNGQDPWDWAKRLKVIHNGESTVYETDDAEAGQRMFASECLAQKLMTEYGTSEQTDGGKMDWGQAHHIALWQVDALWLTDAKWDAIKATVDTSYASSRDFMEPDRLSGETGSTFDTSFQSTVNKTPRAVYKSR